MIAYKALLHSSMAIKVDAHYTSKACPRCGYTSDANRPKKGLLFVCQNCHYTLHADLVGARNITMRTLLVRQDWRARGSCQLPLMCRARKPKRHAFAGMPSCGGAQTQAPAFRHGVIDLQ